jgi:hypothetical protein
MDRLDADVDQERVEYWRQKNHDDAATLDQDLPEEDRRDRAECLVGSNLKPDDDALIVDCIPFRVVGPGTGRNVVLGYYPPWFGDEAVGFEIFDGDLTDRAPKDPAEEPLPIFLPEEPAEPPPEVTHHE